VVAAHDADADDPDAQPASGALDGGLHVGSRPRWIHTPALP
jgi:hypothetical protein